MDIFASTHIPRAVVQVGMCLHLKDINVLNNPHLYSPPEEMLVRGTASLLAFMQRLLQASALHRPEVMT